MQTTLKLAGYWPGAVDGEWTPELTEALKAFQEELGVEPSGEMDPATLHALQTAIAEAQGDARGRHHDDGSGLHRYLRGQHDHRAVAPRSGQGRAEGEHGDREDGQTGQQRPHPSQERAVGNAGDGEPAHHDR